MISANSDSDKFTRQRKTTTRTRARERTRRDVRKRSERDRPLEQLALLDRRESRVELDHLAPDDVDLVAG